ncbi:MAG: HAMP domain-containing sensor histidine kinase [Aerococcus sp.]|nr:HAMP domain-containing sensor histidine kinase [Aerococcus sp.]
MRFRYFYQQLFVSFIIISILLLALSFSAMQLTRNAIYQSTNEMLDNAMSYVTSRDEISAEYLKQVSSLLEHWHVSVAYVNEDNHYVFPEAKAGRQSHQLLPEELDELKQGHTLNLHPYRFQAKSQKDDESLSIIKPLTHAKDRSYAGYLVVGTLTKDVDYQIRDMNHAIIFSGALAGTLAIGFAFLIARYQTRRITRFQEGTRAILQGHYDYRMESTHRDEFDDLAEDFNQMAQSLDESWQEIERQSTLRDQLLMDVAHEMRTPLTTMNGLLEGLRYHVIPENKVDRSLELLHNETQRLTRLVNSNLDYEKLKSHEVILNPISFALAPLLYDIKLQLHDFSEEKNDEIIVDVKDTVQVYADSDRFRQIVFNITQNALQFTSDGTVTLKAWNEENRTLVKISDSGIGMDADQLDNIWERFYKADESRKSHKYGESGLGLAIVKQLVSAHHAQIKVESVLGEGTTFTMCFPATEAQARANATADETKQGLTPRSAENEGGGYL